MGGFQEMTTCCHVSTLKQAWKVHLKLEIFSSAALLPLGQRSHLLSFSSLASAIIKTNPRSFRGRTEKKDKSHCHYHTSYKK